MWVPISFFAMPCCSSQEKTVGSAEKCKMSSPKGLAAPLLLRCWEVLSKGCWTSKPSASLWTWLMSFQRVMRSWKCGQDFLPPSQAFTKPMSASPQVYHESMWLLLNFLSLTNFLLHLDYYNTGVFSAYCLSQAFSQEESH